MPSTGEKVADRRIFPGIGIPTDSDFYTKLIGLCVVYSFTALLGLKFSAINHFAAIFWPPTGVAFVGLMIWGKRFWPAIFIGAFAANYHTGASIPVAAGIAAGNTLEAIVAVALCSSGQGFHIALDRFHDVRRLIIRAAALSTIVSASIGVFAVWSGGVVATSQILQTWLQWWAGDALSDLTFAPLLLLAGVGGTTKTGAENLGAKRLLHSALFVCVTTISSLVILTDVFETRLAILTGLKGIYMLFPFLLWGALSFGQKGAVLGVFVISEVAIICTAGHIGPFSLGAVNADILHLLIFVFIVALTGLVVGAVVTERENERRDLTISKAELKLSKEAADNANTAKTAFLANMSHEIRTPLGAVMGFAELLGSGSISEDERQLSIEAIERNGLLLSNIIDDILDLSRIEAGKLKIEKTQVVLNDVLFDLKNQFTPRSAEKGICLKISAEAPVPERFETDPLRLQQVLLNVVGNAIKFTDRGQVEVVAKQAKGEAGKPLLGFVVKDTGQGITREQGQKLFQPFTQADSSITRKFGGTGLGLSLSKRIAQALGGDVTLTESAPGVGSVFTITIDPKEDHTHP